MKPIVRWLGGKTQLLPELRRRMPRHIHTYVEPFVGGGALFFNMCPTNGIISDVNRELINVYRSLRDHKEELVSSLSSYERAYNSLPSMEAKQNFYYQIRSEFNDVGFETDLTIEDAVRFIFLNKTNYNGLFRVNAAGDYNAAFGWKESIKTNDEANLSNCSVALQNVEIMNSDFENACKGLAAGDFVYFDPPYHSTFDGYQKGGFSEDDHMRLHNLFQHLSENGVYCMLSNSNTDFVMSLYGGYYVEVVSAKRMVNRDGSGRTGEELIITNYLN